MAKPAVGVLTLVDLKNYGNRLQNFAIHEMLRDRGFAPQTLEISARPLRSHVRDLYYATAKDVRDGGQWRGRYREFWDFSRRYVPHKPLTEQQLIRDASKFEFFTIGSDQVWNPNDSRLGGLASGVQCLTHVPPHRRIPLAPSFGLGELSSAWERRYQEWLATFEALSVREEAGAQLIRKLTGIEAKVIVDPTMALTPEKWRSVAAPVNVSSNGYIVTLFLGKPPLERDRQIERLARSRGWSVVNLADPNDSVARGVGPRQFISLIDGASLVATDSFHCSVFAFMLGTGLAIYDRAGAGGAMSSRLETLKSTFGLHDRQVTDHESLSHEILSGEYTFGHAALAGKRQEFAEFLDRRIERVRQNSSKATT